MTGFPEEYSRFSDANDETDLLSVLSKWSTKSTPTDNRDGRMLSQTFSFPFPQNCTFFYLYLQQYTPQEGALVAASARPSLWHRPSNPIILCALTKASCSQTLLLVLILPRSSHFPKQLLHPLTQRLWKISLHRYILMLNSNFIPLYRCSDARNKLNKNMFSFPGIFVRLNTQIAS